MNLTVSVEVVSDGSILTHHVVAMTKKYQNFSLKSAIKTAKLCLKTSQFIKLCKGDMNHRPETAKINLVLNHRVTFGNQIGYIFTCIRNTADILSPDNMHQKYSGARVSYN